MMLTLILLLQISLPSHAPSDPDMEVEVMQLFERSER